MDRSTFSSLTHRRANSYTPHSKLMRLRSLKQCPTGEHRLTGGRIWVIRGHLHGKRHLRPMATDEVADTWTQAQEVPGSYGPPLLGVALDRINYFIIQGRDEFFHSLITRYKSTVIRVNMPPGPPLFPDSRTIMLLDHRSIQVLFDTSRVEKKNVFAGTYMPSTDYTGGFRLLPYIDPSEPQHAPLKAFCFEILKSNARKWLPEFQAAFDEAAIEWEKQLSIKGEADFAGACQHLTLNFLLRAVLDTDPAAPGPVSLGDQGPSLIQAWLAAQLAPQASFGLPKPLEAVLHVIPLPFHLVSSQYDKLYQFFHVHGQHLLDMAEEKFGLDRDEACHNLLFFVCFNAWGGMQLFLPTIFKRIGAAGMSLQRELAAEVRSTVGEDGMITMGALQRMELVHATVHEVLRIDPPVPFVYGRAKEDMVIESHDASYRIEKGELLGGYQKMAMRDPKVFKSPNSFQPKRFMGPEGKKLLNNITWSNGPEDEEPSLHNKQCAGKDFVNLVARLLVAELFLRYDFFRLGPIQQQGARASYSFTVLRKRRE